MSNCPHMTGELTCTVCQRLDRYIAAADFAKEAIRENLKMSLFKDEKVLLEAFKRLEKCEQVR